MDNLKPGCRRVKFGEVVRLNRETSQNPLSEGIDRFIGLEHLDPGDLRVRSWGNISDGTTFTNRVRPGQVLFGKRRAYQRKIAVSDFDAICSGDIYVFESANPASLLPELLPFICQTDSFFDHAVGTSAGSLSPRTNWLSLADYDFVLPPLGEQRRLLRALGAIAAVDEATRAVRERITQVRAALAVFYFVDLQDSQQITCGDLIATRALTLQTGPFGTVLKASAYKDSGHPVINPVDMVDGRIVLDRTPHVGDDDWLRLEKYWTRAGDMLLGRKRHMDNLVFVQPEHEGYVVGSDCIRFRVESSRVEPRYFFHLLRSETTQHWLQSQAGGNGTVMPGMNEQIIGRLKLCLPELAAQKRIASEFDKLENAETSVISQQADALRLQRALVATLEQG